MSGTPPLAEIIQGWEKGPKRDQIAAAVARRVSDGDYKLYHELPREELCEEFGVTRHTLTRAQRVLAGQGVLRLECRRYVVLASKGFLTAAPVPAAAQPPEAAAPACSGQDAGQPGPGAQAPAPQSSEELR